MRRWHRCIGRCVIWSQGGCFSKSNFFLLPLVWWWRNLRTYACYLCTLSFLRHALVLKISLFCGKKSVMISMICIFMFVCVFMYGHLLCTHLWACINVCGRVFLCVYLWMYLCVFLGVYVLMSVSKFLTCSVGNLVIFTTFFFS